MALDANHLLYRGYYYDFELYYRDEFTGGLGLYYLGSRYYDANIGRFISPDDISYLGANGDLNAYNLYAYCGNNPVMRVDYGGEFWWTAVIVTTVVSLFVNAISAIKEESSEKNFNKESVVVSTVVNTIGDVATVMFPNASPWILSATNAVDVLLENLIDEDNSHKPIGEKISETIVSSGVGFFDGLSVRALGITSEMNKFQAGTEAVKSYLSGIVPNLFKQGFQDFLLDRVI